MQKIQGLALVHLKFNQMCQHCNKKSLNWNGNFACRLVSAPPEPTPPAEKEKKKKKKIPDAAKTAEQIRAEKAAPAVPETSKEVDENEEGEEEEDLDGDELEEGEEDAKNAETPPPPTTALAVPPKTAAQEKINSSTHKCEYNRLMRHMASSATQFPNMAQLWNGNNKDHYFFLHG